MNANSFYHWLASDSPRALVMGIVNVTPDSFSDGGKYSSTEQAIAHAHELIAQGADLLDIGGESTRPGSRRVPADEQIARVLPVIEAVRRESPVLISVDTTLAEVARAVADGGDIIINDISAGQEDPDMLELAAKRKLPIVLMHMQGEPGTMQDNPQYSDVTREVAEFLASRAHLAIRAGVAPNRIVLDPGIGFGKTIEHNLQLLRELSEIVQLGFHVLIGTSRKRFLGAITGVSEPSERVIGSCVSAAWSVLQGASIVRAHDVAQTVQAVRTIEAIREYRSPEVQV